MFVTFDTESKIWSSIKLPGPLNPQANLGQLILNVLERNPSGAAQISADSGAIITYEEMRRRSIRAAQNLASLGYGKGDMVAFAVRNRENVTPVVYGCFLIGAPVNGIDPDFSVEDMAHMFCITKPVLVIADEDNAQTVREACKVAGISPRYVVADKASSEDEMSISELVAETGREEYFFPLYLGNSEELIAAVLCSSGTTGLPKGVCISHANLIHQNALICNISALSSSFSFSSLYWISGFVALISAPFNNGTRYVTTRRFSPDAFFDIVEKCKLTHVFIPPAATAMIVQHPRFEKANLSSLVYYFSGGSPLSTELRNTLQARLPTAKIRVGYGSSEIGQIANDAYGPPREGSVGWLAPNLEAKVLDDSGNQLDVNERGVLWLRYPVKALGYLNNQTATDEVLTADGWLCTGDVVYFDEDGYLFIVDRQKEIVKSAGYSISPTEVEATIEQLPEVQHACVIGLFDAVRQDDQLTAVVKIREGFTLDERCVVDHVARKLAHFKHLRGGVVFVDEMPMTKSGKLKRVEIKMIAEQITATFASCDSCD